MSRDLETAKRSDDDIPGAGTALWRSLKFAYRAEPRLLVFAFVLLTTSTVPDALVALWLKFLAQGATQGNGSRVAFAAGAIAVTTIAGWLVRTVGNRFSFLLSNRVTIALEAHVADLQGSVVTIEHHERPEYLDRLQILKDHVFLLDHLYPALMQMVGSIVRLAITLVLLASVSPVLLGLVIFALPTVFASTWRAGVERKTEERAAPYQRLARHLLDVGTMAGPGKEVRVAGIGERLVGWRRDAWNTWLQRVTGARVGTAAWQAAAWSIFGCAYVAAIVFVASVLDASAGNVLLVVSAGGNLSRFLGMTASQTSFLRWCIEAAQRLAWLEDYAASREQRTQAATPQTISKGIRFENVSFRYPGTETWVLRDVDLDLPAGAVVAVVGENGAGKTTLVKLASRFYDPTQGRILVDDTELAAMSADAWRSRLAGAYQDFMRYEFFVRQTVGLGDLARIESEAALRTAVDRGGAQDVIDRLPLGFDTQLGPTWDEGMELSFGQWQKLALARGFMRDRPLLLVLDEPTAALDAETEHALFERFAEASRQARDDGRITILVSHRFSTVRMADLIVVIDDGRIVERGSHDELMARGGLYAELYGIQARAYR